MYEIITGSVTITVTDNPLTACRLWARYQSKTDTQIVPLSAWAREFLLNAISENKGYVQRTLNEYKEEKVSAEEAVVAVMQAVRSGKDIPGSLPQAADYNN